MMKKINAIIGFAALMAIFPTTLSAQKYAMRGMEARRAEITSALDAKVSARDKAIVAPYKRQVDSLMTPVVGRSALYMTAGRPESLLSNFMADVLLNVSGQYGGADLAVVNMGGLRSTMPKGEITYGNLFEITPFENRLCVATLKGRDLLTLFRQMAGVGGEGISGARLIISKDKRLVEATVQGKPIDPEAMYRVATLDYLAEGNDKMLAFKLAQKKEIANETVRQLLIDFVKREAAQGRAVSAKMEGRITVTDE